MRQPPYLQSEKGDGENEGIGAHCENVMTCNQGRDWHAKNGDDTAWEQELKTSQSI